VRGSTATIRRRPNTPGELGCGKRGWIRMHRRRWNDYDPEKVKLWVLAILLAVWALACRQMN